MFWWCWKGHSKKSLIGSQNKSSLNGFPPPLHVLFGCFLGRVEWRVDLWILDERNVRTSAFPPPPTQLLIQWGGWYLCLIWPDNKKHANIGQDYAIEVIYSCTRKCHFTDTFLKAFKFQILQACASFPIYVCLVKISSFVCMGISLLYQF